MTWSGDRLSEWSTANNDRPSDGASSGDHVCWVVTDPSVYVAQATTVLTDAHSAQHKPVVLGPRHSTELDQLSAVAVAVDPYELRPTARLDPDVMFDVFREQTASARAEGYQGVCVVADMDWLTPLNPTTAEMVAFELLLDRVILDLDMTVICAYRQQSGNKDTVEAACCVHPTNVGNTAPPQFRLVAAPNNTWVLSGEIDLAVASTFTTALECVTASDGECVIDVAELTFIDLASLHLIANTAQTRNIQIRLINVAAPQRRLWDLTGLTGLAAGVELIAP